MEGISDVTYDEGEDVLALESLEKLNVGTARDGQGHHAKEWFSYNELIKMNVKNLDLLLFQLYQNLEMQVY